MWDYTEKVRDHFLNPRNAGSMDDPSAVGEAGSLACGDQMKLMLKIDRAGIITDARFQTFGCGSAVASASALTEMIIGKPLDEAARITNRDIADYLGGLPAEKMHCSVMGREALDAAIQNFRGESPQTVPDQHGHVVCECFGVTDREILQVAAENNLKTVEDITNFTKAGGGCRSCHDTIRQLLETLRDTEPAAPATAPGGTRLTNLQKIKLIEETFEKEIRPMLKSDGGDIELIDVDGNTVYVALRGMCSSCPSAQFTLKKYIEPKLREFVGQELIVEETKS